MDRLKEIGIYVLFLGILYLFFRSYLVILLMPPIIFFYHRHYKKSKFKKKKEKLGLEFKDFLLSLSAGMRAGYSVENALREAKGEMQIMYGIQSPICVECKIMQNQLNIGMPIEDIFSDLALRNKVEDIETFASVFQIAKRTGGDMVEIINKTAQDLSSKVETKKEIGVIISAKRFEKNIMSVMPLCIIMYLNISTDGLLEPLYGNLKGVIIMAAALATYAFAYFIAGKVMDIEV